MAAINGILVVGEFVWGQNVTNDPEDVRMHEGLLGGKACLELYLPVRSKNDAQLLGKVVEDILLNFKRGKRFVMLGSFFVCSN